MIELRDYQQRTVDICRKHAADGYTRILVVAPTGSGKACTAAAIMHSALRNFGARCLLFVHRQEIINHVIRQLARFGVTEVGVMRADDERTDPSQPIQVASTATLVRRDLPDAEIVIIDECFPAGVLVDETPIEHVRVGDLVSSFDPKTGGRCI